MTVGSKWECISSKWVLCWIHEIPIKILGQTNFFYFKCNKPAPPPSDLSCGTNSSATDISYTIPFLLPNLQKHLMCKITSVISRASQEKSSFSSAQAVNTQKRATANNSSSLSALSRSSVQTTSWHRATTWGSINPTLINFKKDFPEALERIKEKSCNWFWQSHPMILIYIF